MKKIFLFPILLAMAIVLAPNVYGMPILTGTSADGLTWTASDADGRSASAVFSILQGQDGQKLKITLTNTAAKTTEPNTVLGGIFFDISCGQLELPHVFVGAGSIVVSGGSTIMFPGGNLDGEWGYLTDINGINGGLGYYGISSTGFDPEPGAPAGWEGFGAKTVIGTNLWNAKSPNGAESGLVGDDISELNQSIDPYVQSSVDIVWGFNSTIPISPDCLRAILRSIFCMAPLMREMM